MLADLTISTFILIELGFMIDLTDIWYF